jgi:hypothetical protein
MKSCLLVGFIVLAGCATKPVPGVCCLGVEDCRRLDLGEDRPCPEGLACVNFHCVLPSCSRVGCSAEAPVCAVTTDVCSGCSDSADCSRFGDTGVCDARTGSCVECLVSTDCTAAEPVCDRSSCRRCKLDSECASGACSEDGSCVPEDAIVYISPGGTDAGACTRAAPCKGLQFGVRRTSAARNHIVLDPGEHQPDITPIDIDSQTTSASTISIHGGGARLASDTTDGIFYFGIPAVVRDLEIDCPVGAAVTVKQAILERLKIRSRYAVSVIGSATIRDAFIEGTSLPGYSVYAQDGELVIERATLVGNGYGIVGFVGSHVKISNVLVYGATDAALYLPNATGSVEFSTIVDSGSGSGSNSASGIVCPDTAGLPVRSSIIWTPGTRPATSGRCMLSTSIVGPIGVPGTMNVDPRFVDPAAHNYRLSTISPARDMVDTGPALDFEGDPRPKGLRFDIGADESD